jgi:hypothetical protein
LGFGKQKPEFIRKMHLRSTLTFIKAVEREREREREVRELGDTMGLLVQGLGASGP